MEKVGNVYSTKDYNLFKILDGNRTVEKSRLNKIRDSIATHGYIHCPIVVNEKFEVIDGQGRLAALKDLGLPVEFNMFEGLTINDCIVLNTTGTPWTIMDYIESHADRGNRNYQFLLHLITKYKSISSITCINAITGVIGNNARVARSIKDGSFECSGEQYERADELLSYVMQFMKTINNFKKGASPYICMALMFAYQVEGIDRERLVKKFEAYYGMDDVPQFVGVDGALKDLTIIYNRRSQKDKIYFEVEYDKYLSGKYYWYASRWAKK